MQSKIMVRGDRLSDLPDPTLLHILSKLWDSKQVVRSSVLSTRWRFLWMSVPLSLAFTFPISDSKESTLAYLATIHRELYYWKSCEKIRRFRYEELYAKDVDLWVHFATKVANVEEFALSLLFENDQRYEFPQFGYKNSSLRELVLLPCQMNPCGSVNWSSLVSLKIGYMKLTDGVMEKVLSGCPNLECLELDRVSGIQRLEISSLKLRELAIEEYYNENHDIWLEILAPHIKHLELLGLCSEIRIGQRNVASLVTAILRLKFDFEDEERNLEKEFSCLKELLHSVARVENLELGSRCIRVYSYSLCMSILVLKGWQSPPSSRKSLELNVAVDQLDFPGICSFLQSSLDLETLVIDWYNNDSSDLLSTYTNEDEQIRRYETHNFNGSFPHLKTIKFDNLCGLLSENEFVLPLVKYLLKHATMLKKFVIAATFLGSDVFPDYAKMTQEFLSFPRSSLHVSVVFSY